MALYHHRVHTLSKPDFSGPFSAVSSTRFICDNYFVNDYHPQVKFVLFHLFVLTEYLTMPLDFAAGSFKSAAVHSLTSLINWSATPGCVFRAVTQIWILQKIETITTYQPWTNTQLSFHYFKNSVYQISVNSVEHLRIKRIKNQPRCQGPLSLFKGRRPWEQVACKSLRHCQVQFIIMLLGTFLKTEWLKETADTNLEGNWRVFRCQPFLVRASPRW